MDTKAKVEQIMKYGTCRQCGAPRGARIKEDEERNSLYAALVCYGTPSHDEDC